MPPHLARFLAREDFDVVVIGAGPAGAAAAVEAAALGLRVAVVDEHALAGGQVYRAQPGIAPARADPDRTEGDRLRAQLGAAPLERLFLHRAWHLARHSDGFQVHLVGPDGPRSLDTAAVIVATGAQERHLPFTGWERPGVLGLAAATVMLKAQRVLPGRNVVVAGAGPLLLLVAKTILEGGGRVAAVVDAHPRSAWFASAAEMLSRPDLATRGMGWYRSLLAKGVPLHHGTMVHAVEGDAPALRATIVGIDRDARPLHHAPLLTFACDAVCVGYGLMPGTEATRLLGAAHAFDPAQGGWHAVVDDDQRCTVPRRVCGRRRRWHHGRGSGAVDRPGSRHGRGARLGQARRRRACRKVGTGEAGGRPRDALRQRDDAHCRRRRRRRRGGAARRRRVPLRGTDARRARRRHRRRLHHAGRPRGGDALRDGPVRRPRMRGVGGAPRRAAQRTLPHGDRPVHGQAAAATGRPTRIAGIGGIDAPPVPVRPPR